MVDWWQAVLLLAAGTFLALATAYVQRGWGKSDALEAAERERQYRVEEERREAVRRQRRERVQPVLDFLMLAKQYRARDDIEEIWGEEGVRSLPVLDAHQVTHAAEVAIASASTPELIQSISEVWNTIMGSYSGKDPRLLAMDAVRSAETVVEQYITEV